MNYDEQLQDLIDRYIQGELDGPQQEAFAQRLQNEPEFAEIVRLNQEVNATLADSKAAEFRNNLNTIRAQREQKVRLIQPLWIRAAAAVGLLVIVALAWFLLQPGNSNPEMLFAENFSMGYIEGIERTDVEASKLNNLEKAQLAYNDSLYTESLGFFNAHLSKDPDDAESRIYAAKAAVATDDLPAAVDLLIPVSNSSSPWKWEASWNLALINLKQGKLEEGQKRLEIIAKEADGPMAKKAKKLLKALP